MSTLTVRPTSRNSAVVEDVVLRETGTTRLVFRPQLVNNIHNSDAPLKGAFLFQRRTPKGSWIDENQLQLSKLRAEEWVKLEIKTGELLKLFKHMNDLYSLYRQAGIPTEQTQFIRVESHIQALLSTNQVELEQILNAQHEIGLAALARLLTWVASTGEANKVVSHLESLGPSALQKMNMLIGIGTLKNVLGIWHANKSNANEEFWQRTLAEYAFVISQVFSFPVVVLKDKAYVGGKGVGNTGGHIADFLVRNRLTTNVALVEIKTPSTRLVGDRYRNQVYRMSSDVVGAVLQVSTYRDSLLKHYYQLVNTSDVEFDAFSPQCLVVVGCIEDEHLDRDQTKSFELFRAGLKDVIVITFDELFVKIQVLLDLLEGHGESIGLADETEIPF